MSGADGSHGRRRHGPTVLGDGRTRFSVWAPRAERVEVVLEGADPVALGREADGYHVGVVAAGAGTRYRFRLDGRGPFADPASRLQPEGVHGPSEVVAGVVVGPAAGPGAGTGRAPGAPVAPWRGMPRAAQVVCEVHVGTFSPAGTFDGVADRLPALAGAGYTAVELMPVAAFPGTRNWGYDGVFPYAVQASYGGPEGLRRLTGAAHRLGLAVLLDVVYNHLGPEGAVQEEFGPYLTDRYATPWGKAVNVDGPGSDEVRRYFVEHACYAVGDLGVDGLRLDAVHEIADQSASGFVAELCAAVHAEGRRLGRTVTVVAESPANDPRLVTPAAAGGIGCDGVWNDDFHHALRVALPGQDDRYFGDYDGVADLAEALVSGFVATGRHVASRGRRHGAPPARPLGGDRLVVFAQNHDQIGNGGHGRRLAAELGLAAQFPVAAAVLLSGWVPLRFMGEEYGETAPFHFFVDHSDPDLVEAVRAGRRREVGESGGGDPPDPAGVATFEACRPDPGLAATGLHAELLAWQQELLALRQSEPALGSLEPERSSCWYDEVSRTVVLVRRCDDYLWGRDVAVLLRLADSEATVTCPLLEGCALEVLAARHAGALVPGERRTPELDGALPLDLGPYGTLVAALRRPSGDHYHRADGTRHSAVPPRPPRP